jgi:polysulfide reductase chain C
MEKALNTQKVIGWRVGAALFLIAAGAGSYLIGFTGSFTSFSNGGMSAVAVIIAAPLVLIGGLLLLSDMGQKSEFYLTYSRFGSSWMSRGAIFVTAFLVLNLIHIFTGIWPINLLESSPPVHLTLGVIASILAILSMICTGLMLGNIKSIPFWSSAFLPCLFLLSGLSNGAMAASLVFSIYKLAEGPTIVQSLITLSYFNFFVLIIQAIVLFIYLTFMNRKAAASVKSLISGKLSPHFWGGVVTGALILPFIIEALKIYAILDGLPLMIFALVGGIVGLIGGFMLRYVIIYGGTRIMLNVKGTMVAPPPEIYETKSIESSYQTFQKA